MARKAEPRNRAWLSLLLLYANHVIAKMEKEANTVKSSAMRSRWLCGNSSINNSNKYPMKNTDAIIAESFR